MGIFALFLFPMRFLMTVAYSLTKKYPFGELSETLADFFSTLRERTLFGLKKYLTIKATYVIFHLGKRPVSTESLRSTWGVDVGGTGCFFRYCSKDGCHGIHLVLR